MLVFLDRDSFMHLVHSMVIAIRFRRSPALERLEQASFFFLENQGRVTGKSLTSNGVADLFSNSVQVSHR